MAGHVERMRDEKLGKRPDPQKMEGERRLRRSRMQWEDAVTKIWEEWEEDGDQHQKIRVGDC